jgi:hypothetical protein
MGLLRAVQEHMVAFIVETNARSSKIWNMLQDVNVRFKKWKNLLCMQFPNMSNEPDLERENIVVRYRSLQLLEETVGELVLPRFLCKVSPSMNQQSKFLKEIHISLPQSFSIKFWS